MICLAFSVLCCLSGAAWAVPAAAHSDAAAVRLGIVRFTRPSPNEMALEQTLQELKSGFSNRPLTIRLFSLGELTRAVEKGEVDIFIASAGFFVTAAQFGAHPLASLASDRYPDPNHGDGSAFVVLSDSRFSSIADLQGMRLTATTPTGFTGALVPLGEIARRGFDPRRFFSAIDYVGDGARAVRLLERLHARETDAVALRQCWLEDWLEHHPEEAGVYRVLDEKQDGVCRRSTDLYPTWTIASTTAASPAVVKQVTQTVLAMPKTADGYYWTVGTDFSSIDVLFRELKVGHFSYLRQWTLQRVWREYSTVLIVVLLLVLGSVVHSVRVTQLVQIRTRALREALAREIVLQHEAREASERLATLQKMSIIGQLSSMIAHELRQPMGALKLYTSGLRRLIERDAPAGMLLPVLDKMEKQQARAEAIVGTVRGYAKGSQATRAPVNLNQIVHKAVKTCRDFGRLASVRIEVTESDPVWMQASALEWETVVVNLLNNADEALQGVDEAHIGIVLERLDAVRGRLTIANNGPLVRTETLRELTQPLHSGKPDGLGLGLSIVCSIVESHGGRVQFTPLPSGGLRVDIETVLHSFNPGGGQTASSDSVGSVSETAQ